MSPPLCGWEQLLYFVKSEFNSHIRTESCEKHKQRGWCDVTLWTECPAAVFTIRGKKKEIRHFYVTSCQLLLTRFIIGKKVRWTESLMLKYAFLLHHHSDLSPPRGRPLKWELLCDCSASSCFTEARRKNCCMHCIDVDHTTERGLLLRLGANLDRELVFLRPPSHWSGFLKWAHE